MGSGTLPEILSREGPSTVRKLDKGQLAAKLRLVAMAAIPTAPATGSLWPVLDLAAVMRTGHAAPAVMHPGRSRP